MMTDDTDDDDDDNIYCRCLLSNGWGFPQTPHIQSQSCSSSLSSIVLQIPAFRTKHLDVFDQITAKSKLREWFFCKSFFRSSVNYLNGKLIFILIRNCSHLSRFVYRSYLKYICVHTFPFPSGKNDNNASHMYYSQLQIPIIKRFVSYYLTRMASCDIIDEFVHCTHLRKHPDLDRVCRVFALQYITSQRIHFDCYYNCVYCFDTLPSSRIRKRTLTLNPLDAIGNFIFMVTKIYLTYKNRRILHSWISNEQRSTQLAE